MKQVIELGHNQVRHTGLEPQARQAPDKSATHTFEPRLGQLPLDAASRICNSELLAKVSHAKPDLKPDPNN